MGAVAKYLADTSALSRLYRPTVYASLGPRIELGLVATCAMVEFEVLWSTRTATEFAEVRADRAAGYEWLPINDEHWQRALEVQAMLWSQGQARSVPLPDLIVAAVAESNRVTVVHYDADYDTIASLTGQPMEWVVERGSVP